MAESIFTLTLEILFWLTGEDYTVVKKTSSDVCQAPINEQKILELTNKMIELLTGEVDPVREQQRRDVPGLFFHRIIR
ncbi:hypothetical protein GDO78_016176 [Eleutherodactylus coqui]|uniref:Uncharacterized protein n=1 Tax=Eleutherodactylus coqui TaxID=57060 RepID=A0A8J6BBL5_ELECQ|nr:hypothetical protein GDO78_016176 [Eleutherodactylus coqui]